MPTADNLGHWWLTTAASWNRLHAVPGDAVDPNNEDACERLRVDELTLTARCGVQAVMAWPGIFSRLGRPRCAHCCRVLGIPPGNGTPGNERAREQRTEGDPDV
jgi:hypothetical protein